ncbi:hypothetical protein HFN12_14280 [Faecalicatena fissicatena]|uniref:hypothetical protein n=1 Tax=Faecalicatena fissicatena TaxID=290055 RepID=UPI0015708E44|nr:hypothetical protein [Faecalicatena fissicatena]NSD83909.1 hypothetical protein [Faecalicatena fissicatena]
MNNEELKAKIEKEEKELLLLKEKRAKIDNQIKARNEKIAKYKNEINEREMKELKDNLSKSGMSLEDLQRAIASKDLSAIQQKLRNAENNNA